MVETAVLVHDRGCSVVSLKIINQQVQLGITPEAGAQAIIDMIGLELNLLAGPPPAAPTRYTTRIPEPFKTLTPRRFVEVTVERNECLGLPPNSITFNNSREERRGREEGSPIVRGCG